MRIGAGSAVAFLLICLAALSGAQQTPAKSSSSSKTAAKRRSAGAATAFDPGAVSNGTYHNLFFGFSYKIPYGWVERSQEVREDAAQGKVLLQAFERPPEAAGEGLNAFVLIVAESVSAYPGLKTAADYFAPLNEVITAKGFKVANEPYEFTVGARQLARSDYTRDAKNLTAYQSTLVLLARGYVVSFSFTGSSEDQVEEMIEGLGK